MESKIYYENKSITFLSVDGNLISEIGASHLANTLIRNSMLSKLSISDNQVGNYGVAKIASALAERNGSLTYLDLSGNHISYNGGLAIINMLTKNDCLREVVLARNRLTDDIVVPTLLMLTSNQKVTTLYLEESGLNGGLEQIRAKVEQNQSLDEQFNQIRLPH